MELDGQPARGCGMEDVAVGGDGVAGPAAAAADSPAPGQQQSAAAMSV